MSKNIRTQTGKIIGKTLNTYHSKLKPKLDDLKFKEQYQGRIIDCMVGEVDDNYIETPETDSPIVKLEHSKEGLVKVPSIKGKTVLIDAEGNETDTPSEGCRLVSVGENEDNKLIFLSKNKNLFDVSKLKINSNYGTIKNGEIIINTSSTYAVVGLYEGDCIYQEGKTYTLNCDVISERTGGYAQIVIYDKDNNKILDKTSQGNPNTFTIPSGAKTMKYIVTNGTANNTQVVIKNIQIEERTQSTSYEPYSFNKTEILLDEPLRKIDGDTYDEIVGNKLIQKTKKVVLDGSEHWSKRSGSAGETTYCFECRLTTRGVLQYNTQCKSNNLPTNVGAWVDREHIWLNEWCSATVHISKEKIGEYDVELFKEWLTNNPIELIYQIEPVIIEMPNTLTLQGFDDTTMYIENSITPIIQYGYNALIPYKEELRTQKEEVETNTLDIENNIIPYLMDIEMNLMLMED